MAKEKILTVITIEHEFKFSEENLIDLLSSASYGITYWAQNWEFDKYDEAKENLKEQYRDVKGHVICLEDVQARSLILGGNCIIDDDEEGTKCSFDFPALVSALKTTMQNYGYFDDDEWDSEFADSVIQRACFGKVIYG